MPEDTVRVCNLSDKRCSACTGTTPALSPEEIAALQAQTPEWKLGPDGKEISREFKLRNFPAVLGFVNAVGIVAETENHHPDILIHKYRLVRFTLTTHAIKALSENDYIVAAKIDALAATSTNILK